MIALLDPPPVRERRRDVAIESALAEMRRRTERRNAFATHLGACETCRELGQLCASGAGLMRAAIDP